MAKRKPMMSRAPDRPELDALIEEARRQGVTDEQLAEQRVSFVYGNAPDGSRITKESVSAASHRARLIGAN